MFRKLVICVTTAVLIQLSGCASQTPPTIDKESSVSDSRQRAAQDALMALKPDAPNLKRKVALGRITNETNYGQSLLRDRDDDPLGKQVTDLLSKALTESGAYLVFERPDIAKLKDEAQLSGEKLNLIGVDTLIIGSLTEFGRKTVGKSGFASATKKQVAFAKIDLRLVDAKTGHVFFATSGAGESSTESGSTFGFGSRAGYDGTLNDSAIRQAISDAVSRLSNQIQTLPWQTYILRIDANRVFIGGGKHQGILPGARFSVLTAGEVIKSPQTGAMITLPGRKIAELRVDSNFGDTVLDEGSVASIVSGSLGGFTAEQLIVRIKGNE